MHGCGGNNQHLGCLPRPVLAVHAQPDGGPLVARQRPQPGDEVIEAERTDGGIEADLLASLAAHSTKTRRASLRRTSPSSTDRAGCPSRHASENVTTTAAWDSTGQPVMVRASRYRGAP